MDNRGISIFRRFGIVNIIAIYLVILAGGVVRTTGSGMGCPDWPKCFGRWVPPTEESQLPPDWKEKYSDAHTGYIAVFNPVETWIEYGNRLLGALIGVFTLVVAILSLSYRKVDPAMMWLSFLSLLIVILEGVVGKMVVDHNLDPSFVSFHFYGSIVIILLMIYIVARSRKEQLQAGTLSNESGYIRFIIGLMLLTIVQIYLGSRVRHNVDLLSENFGYDDRINWIFKLSIMRGLFGIPDFLVHRTFSVVLLAANLWFAWKILNEKISPILKTSVAVMLIMLGVEIATGITMNYFRFPAAAQPIHMLNGTMIISAQFLIWVILRETKITRLQTI